MSKPDPWEDEVHIWTDETMNLQKSLSDHHRPDIIETTNAYDPVTGDQVRAWLNQHVEPGPFIVSPKAYEELRAIAEQMRVRLQPALDLYAQIGRDVTTILGSAGVIVQHNPNETVAERALRLRRTRNTGPTQPGPQDRKRTR